MKPNLILLHGALGTETQMIKIEERFKSHYTVHSFTFLGHGTSELEGGFSIQLLVDQLRDYILENDLNNVSIFGYSMGGYVALKYAMTQKSKLDHIFTFGTKFNWTQEGAEKEVKKLNPELIEEKVPHFASWLKSQHGENHWRTVLFNTAEMMRSLGTTNDLMYDDLSEIQCLVTINLGDQDQMADKESSELIAERLPKGKFNYLMGVGHELNTIQDDHWEVMMN